MFIRCRDTVKMIGNGKEISFLNSNRKGNVVKKFKLNANSVEFFDDELLNKMIPKKDSQLFENKDINNMTPIEALKFLAEIKVKIEEIK